MSLIKESYTRAVCAKGGLYSPSMNDPEMNLHPHCGRE